MPNTWSPQHEIPGRLVGLGLATLLAVAMLVFVPGTMGQARAGDGIVAPPCPFDSSPERILVDGGFLLGEAPLVPNAITVDTSIPRGIYRVSWASFDAHKSHPFQTTQTEEIWYLDAGGYVSDATMDIPDEPTEFIQGVLNSYFVVGADQSSIMIRHGGPADKYNSVYPVCAALDPVPAPTLTILKNAVNGDGDFSFLSQELGSFSIVTASGNGSREFASLEPGTYNVAEDLQALGKDWSFTSLTCEGATGSAIDGAAASVTLRAGDVATCTFTNTNSFEPAPQIDIEKSTNEQDADSPTGPQIPVGSTVTWTYVVTNAGNVPLTNITVTDDVLGTISGPISGDEGNDGVLGLTETWTYEAVGTATAGQYANLGTATGDYAQGESRVSDSDQSHYLGVLPPVGGSLTIDKLVDDLGGIWVEVATYPADQATVTWQVTVSNPTDGDVFKVTLTDAVAPSCETALDDALTAKGWTNTDGGYLPGGESITVACTEDLVAGAAVVNVAIANGVDQYGRAVPSVQDDAEVNRVLANASIGDTVWSDENENGVQDNGEKGIAGATVRLTLPDGTVAETTTNSNGLYLFSALETGKYTVTVVLSSIPKPSEGDLALTTAGSFTIQLADGQSYLDADFGVVATLPKTGLDTGAILGIALALLLGGAATVLVARRKEDAGDALA